MFVWAAFDSVALNLTTWPNRLANSLTHPLHPSVYLLLPSVLYNLTNVYDFIISYNCVELSISFSSIHFISLCLYHIVVLLSLFSGFLLWIWHWCKRPKWWPRWESERVFTILLPSFSVALNILTVFSMFIFLLFAGQLHEINLTKRNQNTKLEMQL